MNEIESVLRTLRAIEVIVANKPRDPLPTVCLARAEWALLIRTARAGLEAKALGSDGTVTK